MAMAGDIQDILVCSHNVGGLRLLILMITQHFIFYVGVCV